MHASHLTNDVLFTRLSKRSIVTDQHNEQLKWARRRGVRARYIIVIVGDEQHSVWCNNLFTLLKKVTADDTLYNELFMAKDKENVIQAFANTAVRVQILVRTRWRAEQ